MKARNNMTNSELDRLLAMLEPQANSKTIDFVRTRLADIMQSAFTNDYVPRRILDDEVFPPADIKEQRTDQQRVDVYEVKDYNKDGVL